MERLNTTLDEKTSVSQELNNAKMHIVHLTSELEEKHQLLTEIEAKRADIEKALSSALSATSALEKDLASRSAHEDSLERTIEELRTQISNLELEKARKYCNLFLQD